MVILADGFEEGETTTIIEVLRSAGFETHGVSINGGEIVTGVHDMRMFADWVLEEEILDEFRDYDAIVLPGDGALRTICAMTPSLQYC